MMNDQSSDTLDSEEYIKVDSDHDMDQIFTDEEEITDQSNTGKKYFFLFFFLWEKKCYKTSES